jgi:hypothetical protein
MDNAFNRRRIVLANGDRRLLAAHRPVTQGARLSAFATLRQRGGWIRHWRSERVWEEASSLQSTVRLDRIKPAGHDIHEFQPRSINHGARSSIGDAD